MPLRHSHWQWQSQGGWRSSASEVLFHPGDKRVVQRLQGAIEGGIHHPPFPDHPSAIQGPDEGAIVVVVADFDLVMGRDPLLSASGCQTPSFGMGMTMKRGGEGLEGGCAPSGGIRT